jgi:hypothetical protein
VTRFHPAQVNIGRLRAPLDDPIMEGPYVRPRRDALLLLAHHRHLLSVIAPSAANDTFTVTLTAQGAARAKILLSRTYGAERAKS